MIRLKITFRGTRVSDTLGFCIQQQVEKLDAFGGPIQSCEVVVQKELQPNQTRIFQVHAHILVAGAEIVVSHNDLKEEDRSNPYAVVRDTFDIARRQLQEFRQRERGEVKSHATASV